MAIIDAVKTLRIHKGLQQQPVAEARLPIRQQPLLAHR